MNSTSALWQSQQPSAESGLWLLLQQPPKPQLATQNPLTKIRKQLGANLLWFSLLLGFYGWLLWQFQQWPILLCMGAVFAFTAWALAITALHWWRTRPLDPEQPLLPTLKRHYSSIQRWQSWLRTMAQGIYPVSAAGGFLMGGSLGQGGSAIDFLSHPMSLIAFLVLIAAARPLCMWLTKRYCKQHFAQHLAALKANIEALEKAD